MNRGTTGVNNLPKTVTRQRRDCDLNPGPSPPESSTLTTRLTSHPPWHTVPDIYTACGRLNVKRRGDCKMAAAYRRNAAAEAGYRRSMLTSELTRHVINSVAVGVPATLRVYISSSTNKFCRSRINDEMRSGSAPHRCVCPE